MRPSQALDLHRDDIRRIVARHRGTNPRVFGSVARGEDREGSDLDILVDKQPRMSLLDLAEIREEIMELAGVPVDVMTSYFTSERRKKAILSEAKPI